jgi:DNA-binding CsgD family transcriptional regulator
MKARNQRTRPEVERSVVELIALGTRYSDISRQTGLHISTIKKIKRRNKEIVLRIQHELVTRQIKAAQRIHGKAIQLIARYMNDIDAGKQSVSIMELLAISKEMHRQSLLDPEPVNPTPSPERTRALLVAIKNNDSETIASLVFSNLASQKAS